MKNISLTEYAAAVGISRPAAWKRVRLFVEKNKKIKGVSRINLIGKTYVITVNATRLQNK